MTSATRRLARCAYWALTWLAMFGLAAAIPNTQDPLIPQLWLRVVLAAVYFPYFVRSNVMFFTERDPW